MKKILPFVALILLFVSCKKISYRTSTELTDNRWQKTDVKEFTLALQGGLKNADVDIFFSHVYEPGYSKVPVEVEITYPGGKQETISVELELKDNEGKSLSDCSGDICDLKTEIKSGVNLKGGLYTFRIKNNFNNVLLPNVLAVGVDVRGN